MDPMQITVLNPKGRDPEQSFAEGPGAPEASAHPPVNFHAYAACSGGTFHCRTERALEEGGPVLVLLRRRLSLSLEAVRRLKQAGRRVFVSWKECGPQQAAAQLAKPQLWEIFLRILRLADGTISPVPDLLPLYRAAGEGSVHFIPTPYPVDFPEWDFSRPLAEREGIWLGTRSFDTPARCHLAAFSLAVQLARESECPLSVVNTEGKKGLRFLNQDLGLSPGQLRILDPAPYPDHLRRMARHRLVLQLDNGAVPGQVAGDSLLCRMPCLGGNGVIDQRAFPGLCGGKNDLAALEQAARRLLTDADFWEREVAASQKRAQADLSFRAVADRLQLIC